MSNYQNLDSTKQSNAAFIVRHKNCLVELSDVQYLMCYDQLGNVGIITPAIIEQHATRCAFSRIPQSSIMRNFVSKEGDVTSDNLAIRKKEGETKATNEKQATPTPQQEISDWMDLKQVCDYFKLPKNSIKDRQWRRKHGFPCITRPYEKLRFHRIEVEKWMEKQGKC